MPEYPTQWKYSGYGNEVKRWIAEGHEESRNANTLPAETEILPVDEVKE